LDCSEIFASKHVVKREALIQAQFPRANARPLLWSLTGEAQTCRPAKGARLKRQCAAMMTLTAHDCFDIPQANIAKHIGGYRCRFGSQFIAFCRLF
jgi:hypothetical protein